MIQKIGGGAEDLHNIRLGIESARNLIDVSLLEKIHRNWLALHQNISAE
jgi:hypothetical protein